MTREEALGIKLVCDDNGIKYRDAFTDDKIYKLHIQDDLVLLVDDDKYRWTLKYEQYKNIKDLIHTLNRITGATFKLYEEPKSTSKISEIKVPIKVDFIFDQPVIEETKEEVYIFAGRTTVYINKEFGFYGVSTCHEDEIKNYSKLIGKSIAFYRAFNKEK